MKPRPRPLLAMMALLAILALFILQREKAVSVSAAQYSGSARIDGQLQLDLLISPPIGTPRDTLQLQILLTNHGDSLASPNVQLLLPTNLQADVSKLPSGATINLSTNTIQWLALVPGQNGTKLMSLPLKVTSADLRQPEQTITAILNHQENEQTASATIWIGIPPRILGLVSSPRVSVGQPVQLQVDASGPGPFSEIWDLGDGRLIPLNSPTIVYPSAGVYDLSVTVKNPIGSTSHTSQITVLPHVAANFQPKDNTPGIGEAVAFVNESGGQLPVRYTWDFGDGTLSNEVHPHHTYEAPGTYLVRLLIENDFGHSEATSTITVGLPPTADILVEEFAPAGEQIAGEAVGDSANTQFVWEMGDGREYDGAKIRHAYRQSGNYYVTLKASNEFGTTQVGRWVRVEPGTLRVYLPLINHLSGLTSGSSAVAAGSNSGIVDGIVDLGAPFIMEPLEGAQSQAPLGQLLVYINEARRQFELPPLPVSTALSAAAQKHTDDMAATQHTQHTGSDGSVPAERQIWHGYSQGYAGEATAWGFPDPRQAVEFWVNSPSHRPIILNPYSTDVGVGYTVDYGAPSVWYWTAEFGNSFEPAEAPSLRLQSPANNLEVLNSEMITFTWNWSQALSSSEKFSIYIYGPGNPQVIGTVQDPILGTRFVFPLNLLNHKSIIGTVEWQIKLENNRGVVLAEGPRQRLIINPDPTIPTPTPTVFSTLVPTMAATLLPTITPTATTIPASPTPRATTQPPPPLVTATPLPTP